MQLRRFWIKFKLTIDDSPPPGVLLGVGVTSNSFEEALELIKKSVFQLDGLPEVERFTEDVDIRELDQGHVVPNMGDPSTKGIWYPLGY